MHTSSIHYDPAWRGDAPIGAPDLSVEVQTTGSWPRMLNLGEKIENLLADYIDSELDAYYQERSEILEDWKNYQTLYWAKPEQKERNFPFKRSANIVVPLAAIAVEAVHARTMNTLFAVEPFFSIRPKSKEWIECAKPFENYLQSEVESNETLDMYGFCNETLLEFFKLGTGVGKVGYERLVKKSFKQVGGEEVDYFAVVRNGASVNRVALANFIMRLRELDPQTAPIVGEHHDFSWRELKRMAQSGRMSEEGVEKIKTYWEALRVSSEPDNSQEYHAHVESLAHTEPLWTDNFEVKELWISFDVNNDGWDEEIVVDYHKPSRTFLSVRYNWYDDLHRPYHIGNYHNVEGIWVGIGICKQVEQFQAEATTIHRQRLDNATLANMAQIVLKKGLGYGPGEPIFPGKMWFVNDVQTDIKEFKLSEVYPSSYANEQAIIGYFEKRTGVNEVILGLPQEGTPGTATSDLARLAEGNKRFDLVLKNIKRFLSGIGVDIITNYQIFGNQNVHWLILGEDGAFVEQVLNMPSVLVRRGAVVDLTVTDSITNRDVEQRQWLALFQVLTNYYRQVIELSQVLGDPQLFATFGAKAIEASDEAVRRLLETYQVPDSDRFTLGDKHEAHARNIQSSPKGNPLALTSGNNGGQPTGPTRFNLPAGVGGT